MQLLNILISRKKTLGCVIPHIGTFHWLAMGPTHGLLSRRSTDRMSTSPLANFAQLSMFRFDGLKIQIKLYYRQQTKLYFMACETYVSVFVGNLFCKDEKKPALAGLF